MKDTAFIPKELLLDPKFTFKDKVVYAYLTLLGDSPKTDATDAEKFGLMPIQWEDTLRRLREAGYLEKMTVEEQTVETTASIEVTYQEPVRDDPKDLTIFRYYLEKAGKNPNQCRLTDGRKKKISARLKDFTIEDLKLAIDHATEDAWYSGDNDRGWVADFDYIIRSTEIVERLIALKPRKKGSIHGKNQHPNRAPQGKYDDVSES